MSRFPEEIKEAEMAGRYLRDGRRVYGKTEVDEMPDTDKPCPECGQSWPDHLGNVELRRLSDGSAGFVMPKCPV